MPRHPPAPARRRARPAESVTDRSRREQPEAEPAAAKPEPHPNRTCRRPTPIETDPSDERKRTPTPKGRGSLATESAKPDDSITAATDASPAAPDVKKDQTRLPNAEKAVVAKPETPKPAGRIAVFVSRKDGKLYVRENFKPLFDVPVTIAPSDRLLGTHVFTAEADKNDTNVLRWSVASLPVSARSALKNDDDERSSRRRRIAGVVPAEMKPVPVPNSPAEALDRITIPPDAMARIAEALSTGGSIVVSDQGINQGGETGEGTDFIVSLR